MRIGMVGHTYYLRDPRVRREAEALAEAGHDVDVFCLRDRGEAAEEVRAGVRIRRLPVRRQRGGASRYIVEYVSFALLAAWAVGRESLRRRFDIIHVHNMPNFLVIAGLIPKLRGARIVLDVHDPMPELLTAEPGMADRRWVLPVLDTEERFSSRVADHILTVNEPMRERLIRRGIAADKVSVIMNLPDDRLFSDRAVSSAPSDRFRLVYAGTVAERYGLDLALEAMDTLRHEMPDLELNIAGEGPHVPELREQARRLGLNDRVRFLGSVPLEEVSRLLFSSKVGISPHSDGPFWELYFSNKIVEYLRAGLPVISSRTRTVEHYLDDSVLFFFPPGDAGAFADQIRLIRREPALVAAKRAAAQERLQTLTWDVEREKLVALVAGLPSRLSR